MLQTHLFEWLLVEICCKWGGWLVGEGGSGTQVDVYIPCVHGMEEMEDVLEFSVILCNSYFISSDLHQKQLELWLSAFQSLKSQNK